jgi:nucleoid-associated protein YgaU
MTRETKIGLLVGLAFIIVIGILLSDHLTSTTEPPQARLAQAGSTARQAINVPGGRNASEPAPLTPPQVTPVQQVPTAQELQTRPQPLHIEIGPGTAQANQARPIGQQTPPSSGSLPVTMEPPLTVANNSAPAVDAPMPLAGQQGPAVLTTPPDPSASPLVQIAQQMGSPLVATDGKPLSTPTQQPVDARQAQPAPATGQRTYKIVEGDTVSKLAGRFMGGNTKANRDAIIRANPSLQRNPDVVVVGQTYVIPATATPAARPAAAPVASADRGYSYVVKPNDSLWGIARNQLGNTGAVAAIKELNKDLLKGGDIVQPGMRLRLPAKPVASANLPNS